MSFPKARFEKFMRKMSRNMKPLSPELAKHVKALGPRPNIVQIIELGKRVKAARGRKVTKKIRAPSNRKKSKPKKKSLR